MKKKLLIAFLIIAGLSLIGLITYRDGSNAVEDLDGVIGWVINNGIGIMGSILVAAFIIYAAYRGIKGN